MMNDRDLLGEISKKYVENSLIGRFGEGPLSVELGKELERLLISEIGTSIDGPLRNEERYGDVSIRGGKIFYDFGEGYPIRSGTSVTKREGEVMLLLMQNVGELFSPEQIKESLDINIGNYAMAEYCNAVVQTLEDSTFFESIRTGHAPTNYGLKYKN